VAALTGLLFALLLMVLPPSMVPAQQQTYAAMAAVGLILLSALLLWVFWQRSSRHHIFYSQHTRVPLVTLYSNKPSRKKVDQFVQLLEQRIGHFHENAHEKK